MREQIERVLSEVGRRAGLRDVPAGVVAAAACLAIAAVAWAGWRWWPRSVPPVVGPAEGAVLASAPAREAALVTAAAGPAAESTASAASTTLFVHVAGMVRRPGVYELSAGSRVVDALQAAGGPVGDAAQDALNLARVLADGEQILVPTKEQAARQPGTTGGAAAAGTTKNAGGGSAPVNINTADAVQLDTLPGVGPSTAAKIIAEREAGGPFSSAEDLSRVSGIGPKRIEQLKGLVSVE